MPHSVWQRLASAARRFVFGMPRLLVQGGLLHQQLAAPAVLVAIGNATENQAVRLPDLLIGRGLHAQTDPVAQRAELATMNGSFSRLSACGAVADCSRRQTPRATIGLSKVLRKVGLYTRRFSK